MILSHRVTREEEGRPLLLILRQSMGLSSTAIKALKRNGGIEVDGVLRFTIYEVKAGELVTANLTQGEDESDNLPEDGEIEVLYEDEGLLAVNKPPGLIVHPTHNRNHGTLANFVAGYLNRKRARPICHIVNRLDRDTSGVVLFAKNAHMKARAIEALKKGKKDYLAITFGVLREPSGTINHLIRRLQPRDMLRIVAPDGKQAVTHYQTVATGPIVGQACSVLDVTLETGRTHQIRVHCLAEGAPLLGDPLYFTEESKKNAQTLGLERQLLHSHSLSFPHPQTGAPISIHAPIRDEQFLQALETLGYTLPEA